MTWILWTELGPRCRGPLAFAAWLADRVGVRFADLVVPVHVLTAEHLRAALRTRHLADLVDAERSAIAGTLAETVGPEAGALDVVQATTADEGLEEARERHGATGVIVARAAACEGRHVVRLGAVARRLVHRLASPVIVVPPDLTASSIGDGPVVAASSLGDDAVPACRLARVVADATGRDLTILHVDEDEQPALAGRGAARLRDVAEGPRAESDRALARWVERHRVWPDLAVVSEGSFPETAAAYAEARRAPLVVVGAVPGSGLVDALERKPWRWLAAHAHQPVLVVPARPAAIAPEWRGDEGAPSGPR